MHVVKANIPAWVQVLQGVPVTAPSQVLTFFSFLGQYGAASSLYSFSKFEFATKVTAG